MSRFSISFFFFLCSSESKSLLGLGIHQRPVIGWRCGGMMVLGYWRGHRDWLLQARTHTHIVVHDRGIHRQTHTHKVMHVCKNTCENVQINTKCTHLDLHACIYMLTHTHKKQNTYGYTPNLKLHACMHTSTQCALQRRDWNQKERGVKRGGGLSLNESFWHRLVY